MTISAKEICFFCKKNKFARRCIEHFLDNKILLHKSYTGRSHDCLQIALKSRNLAFIQGLTPQRLNGGA